MQLSIIIPVHNRADLLAEAIDSIIAQGLDSYEIIICDDGSTENIEAACDTFKLPKEQLVYSRSEESHGAQVARNRGLSLAQGELVMFMEAELAGMPAMRTVFTQPIEMRVNEMVAGIRSDLGVKIFGKEFEQLKSLADQVAEILKRVAGASDVK